jgi:hypothetical protein
MAYEVTDAPANIQTIWQRAEAQGWNDPWYHPAHGLYAHFPTHTNLEDDRLSLCGPDGLPPEGCHLGDPCLFCGQAWDQVMPGTCPGETSS